MLNSASALPARPFVRYLRILIWLPVIATSINVTPTRSFVQELNNQFWCYYFFTHVCLIFVVGWVGSRLFGGRERVLSLLVLLVCSFTYVPVLLPFYQSQPRREVSQSDTSLRVLYANVYVGNKTPERFLEAVKKHSPDVFAVLELNQLWKERFEQIRELYPYQRVLPAEHPFGLGLYSKYPFVGNGLDAIGEDVPSVIEQDLQMPNGELLRFYVVHSYPLLDSSMSSASYRYLRRVATRIKHYEGLAVLVGDLNVTPYSRLYGLFRKASMRNSMWGYGLFRTWNCKHWWIRFTIDYALYKGRLQVENFQVLDSIGSDHLPILIDYRIPNTGQANKLQHSSTSLSDSGQANSFP